jgi:hypothetical protein
VPGLEEAALLDAGVIADGPTLDCARLVVADRAARMGRAPVAADLLRWWYEDRSFTPEDALALRALARMIVVDRVLAPPAPAKLAPKARDLVAAIRERCARGMAPSSTYGIQADYGVVLLEPQVARPVHYFEDPEDTNRGFSLHDDQVAIQVGEGACDVTVIVGPPPRPAGGLAVVRFPLRVTGGLYLRRLLAPDDERPYEVPPGRYDAVVVVDLPDRDERTPVRVTLSPA